MKNKLLIVGLFMLIISCKEKTTSQMQIMIKNDTENMFIVTLFPKEDYMYNELYKFIDCGGGHRNTELEVYPESGQEIFISCNLSQKSYALASEIFDSIHVKLMIESEVVLKFCSDTVIGYSFNLFDSSSYWLYEINKFDLSTNFSRNPVESYDYSFIIEEGSIVN